MQTFTLDTTGLVPCPAVPDGVQPLALAIAWTDLDPFAQGYIEALFAELTSNWLREHKYLSQAFRFSDLAPETLARIMGDCAGATLGREDGAALWRDRQAGRHFVYPPLTAYLGDDGRVYLREEA